MTDTVKIKHGMSVLGLFAILLSIVALGGTSYLYYIGLNKETQIDNKLNSVTQLISAQNDTYANNIVEIKTTVDSFESQVARLSNQKTDYTLLQLNELINMANQSLFVYNDIKSTLKLLNYAQKLLSNNNSPIYVEVKTAIANDIAQLGQIQYTDPVVLSSKINAVLNQITTLPLIDDSVQIAKEIQSTQDNNSDLTQSIWYKFWKNLKHDFASLVKVSSSDKNNVIQLSPEKDVLIRQNLKLDLLNVRMALLQHDNSAWQYNLNNVKNDLGLYFVNNALVGAIIENINGLLQTNISIAGINLDDTLKALNKLNQIEE